MAKFTIVKFKNLTPIHLGTGKENYDFSTSELHSDTIASALATLRASSGNIDNIDSFLGSFSISSAFPYVADTLFLPKPMGRINVTVTDMDEYPSRKKLKKIAHIDLKLWNKLVSGETLEVSKCQINKEFLLSKESIDNFVRPYKAQVNQRVAVSRDETENTDPFFFEWKYFHPDAGLYCILDANDEIKNELLPLFKQLGEQGIGTDRCIGGGQFEVATGEMEFTDLPDANAIMLLSLYIPMSDEMPKLNISQSRYELIMRGGFMSGSDIPEFRHLRKKSVYMFKEGSLFKTTEKLSGSVIDLQPEWNSTDMHPVWRSGRPFAVPIKTY